MKKLFHASGTPGMGCSFPGIACDFSMQRDFSRHGFPALRATFPCERDFSLHGFPALHTVVAVLYYVIVIMPTGHRTHVRSSRCFVFRLLARDWN